MFLTVTDHPFPRGQAGQIIIRKKQMLSKIYLLMHCSVVTHLYYEI